MARHNELELLTVRETLTRLKVDDLKAFVALIGGPVPTRKAELVDRLAGVLENPAEVRALYDGLDDLAKKAIQEATHDPDGVWHRERFAAKYGGLPVMHTPGRSRYHTVPAVPRLFFPGEMVLPTDLRATLLAFVPAPPVLKVSSNDELPARIRPRPGHYADDEEVDLRVRPTERAALLDVKAVLRLIDAGQVKVGEKTRVPSRASVTAIAAVLSEGDFYGEEDAEEDEWDPASDVTVQPFVWPVLIQVANLAGAGPKLQLTPAGRKATTEPAHQIIRQVWGKWQKTTLLDEFNRVEAIKGQQTKGSLTAVAPRREAVVEGLKECPAGKWIKVESLFRQLQASEREFTLSRDEWKLYIGDRQYGSLGYNSTSWEHLEGRYTLSFLFEVAATLGLLDVAYIPPAGARPDFHDCWGTDDLSCLSRYDGLMYFRINPLGAWCLGLAATYEPKFEAAEKVLRVLPNLDVVATDKPPSAADTLFLERFAERRSESVWHLSREKILAAVEQGQAVGEVREFLASRSEDELPQTAAVFLDDLEGKAGLLEDVGAARLIACKDAVVAQTLAADRRLRNVCQVAGERHLVFRATDETAVRKALKELGYVLPPPK